MTKRITLVVPRVIEPESALLGVCSIAAFVNRPDLIRIAIAGRDNYRWDDFEPDVVGFNGWTVEMNLVKSLAVATRKAGFKGKIILGGHHATLLPESESHLAGIFDSFMRGEAEEPVRDLVLEAEPEDEYQPLPGQLIPIPDPAFYPGYKELDAPGRPIAILTARGCINSCRFCATQAFGRKYRMMPVDRVIEMIDFMIRRYPERKCLVIWDDCFTNMPVGRLTQLVDAYIQNGYHKKFSNLAVHGGISWPIKDEVWDQLKRMGVTNFNCGFESGSNRILKWLKGDDRVSVENIKANCLKARSLGINCDGSFQFGAPGETPEDSMDTLQLMDWKASNIPGGIWWFVTCPLPGTEVWKIALANGRVHPNMNPSHLHLHRLGDPLMIDQVSYPRPVWDGVMNQAKQLMAKNNGRPYYQA
jgi:radical SAM superfamily enzyme YgiQ (UPF0313 family)